MRIRGATGPTGLYTRLPVRQHSAIRTACALWAPGIPVTTPIHLDRGPQSPWIRQCRHRQASLSYQVPLSSRIRDPPRLERSACGSARTQ